MADEVSSVEVARPVQPGGPARRWFAASPFLSLPKLAPRAPPRRPAPTLPTDDGMPWPSLGRPRRPRAPTGFPQLVSARMVRYGMSRRGPLRVFHRRLMKQPRATPPKALPSRPRHEAEADGSAERRAVAEDEEPKLERDTSGLVTRRPKPSSSADPSMVLIMACKGGDVDKVREALDSGGATVDATGMWNSTALIVAAQYGHARCALELMGRGADVEARNERGADALLYAATEGLTDVVAELLRRGAEADPAEPASVYSAYDDAKHRVVPLLAAATNGHAAACALLLDGGGGGGGAAALDRCVVDFDGATRTAVSVAAAGGHAEAVALLLARGAAFRLPDHAATLFRAAFDGHEALVLDLLHRDFADARTTKAAFLAHRGQGGATALHAAAMRKLHKGALALVASTAAACPDQLDAADDRGFTPLLQAAATGLVDVVAALLVAGADPNAKDNRNRDARAFASRLAKDQGTKLKNLLDAHKNHMVLRTNNDHHANDSHPTDAEHHHHHHHNHHPNPPPKTPLTARAHHRAEDDEEAAAPPRLREVMTPEPGHRPFSSLPAEATSPAERPLPLLRPSRPLTDKKATHSAARPRGGRTLTKVAFGG